MEAVWTAALAVMEPMAPEAETVSKVLGAVNSYEPAPEVVKLYTPATIQQNVSTAAWRDHKSEHTIVVNDEGLAGSKGGHIICGGSGSGSPFDLGTLELRSCTGMSVGRGKGGGLPLGGKDGVGVVEEAEGGVASVHEGGLDSEVIGAIDGAGT